MVGKHNANKLPGDPGILIVCRKYFVVRIDKRLMFAPNMKTPASIRLESPWFYLAFAVIVILGVRLRLDQFTLQVLLDDEWHVVHQLLAKSPKEMVQSFGRSDFSIPLALLYRVELKLLGLSELGMRWPMMLAGIVVLLSFPLYLRRYFDDKTILIFTFLLATSPILILYSRTARPYALTLLLSILAVALFRKFAEAEKPSSKTGVLYFLCTVTSVWLHSSIVAVFTATETNISGALLYRS